MEFKQRFALISKYRKKWLEFNPKLTNRSGIYILYRNEENFKYAYIGQSKHILQRLAEHFLGYQHVDISLKKRGLFDEDKNPQGWNVIFYEFEENKLDEAEQKFIELYNEMGYQLRYNKTGGGQIDKKGFEQEQTNGYYKGVAYGKSKQLGEIKIYFDKYLDVIIKGKPNKIKERKLKEFKELLEEQNNDTGE